MASGIKNPHLTYGYRADDWPSDSLWTFRREQTSDDRDDVANLTTRDIVKGALNRRELRDILKSGKSIESYVREHTGSEVVMSTEKAMLGIMGVKVEGEFFTVPENYLEEDGTPSPMAGKLIPQPPAHSLRRTNRKQYDADLEAHLKWIGLLDAEERSNALVFMTAVWAGAAPEDVKRFQGSSLGVDESPSRGKPKSKGGA